MVASICLNMIVRDEARLIASTLQNVVDNVPISHWVICDTGSTDGTPEIVERWFEARGIPGTLVRHEWKDFGHNRTLALEAAYNKSDYVLVFDADDKLVGKPEVPDGPDLDGYHMMFRMGNSSWRRLALMNNRKRWRYVGVIHETPICDEACGQTGDLAGDYYCAAGTEGARSRAPNKYASDAETLARAYEDSGLDTWLRDRYAFYCAQSYRDAGMRKPALRWYQKRVALGGWVQELYVSQLNSGWILMSEGNADEAIKCWLAACDYGLFRYETLSEAAEHYQASGMQFLAKALYDQVDVSRVGVDGEQLFLHRPLHEYRLLCDMLLCYARCAAYDRACVVLSELLRRWDRIGVEWQGPVLHNAWYVSCNYRVPAECLRLAIACADKLRQSEHPPRSLGDMRTAFAAALSREDMIASRAMDGIVANVYALA